MAVLIDTSVLVDAERGGRALSQLPADEQYMISVVTVSEMLHGVHRAASESIELRRQALVEELLGALDPLPINEAVARIHSTIWAQLESSGEIIAAHDLWIAATALTHGLRLVTHNARDFQRIPSLDVLVI